MKRCYKQKVKKAMAMLLTLVLTASLLTELGTMSSVKAESAITVTESNGYEEGAYVEWEPVTGADGYQVYVSKDQSSWEILDDELIRNYGTYFRADALGLTAGTWYLKVVAATFDSNKQRIDTLAELVKEVAVTAHDRSGYAWEDGKTASGAYNEDGSLKSDANVIYVTEDTKDTVSLEVTGADSNPCVGIQNILTAYGKGEETKPLCVRMIGNVTDPSTTESGDMLIGNSNNNALGITFEGVGEDATANGWGIRVKKGSNIEIRNIGFMNCNSTEGDNVGVDSCDHVWVHHCDMFYGDAGTDADQVKGDGALDTKKSTYITHSYNHFWDSGKCNLQGASSSDTSNYITYHHNWYDHSDSRHPRIRVATVHVYNNYYDGNSKYGIGSTTDSDVFVENNYFRNCKYPMLTSMQGSDIYSGSSTFSSENGGVIKAYNNYIEGATRFVAYSATDDATTDWDETVEFDAYVATSRDEQVPESVTAKQGGAVYNNFDTAEDFYEYKLTETEDVPTVVTANAGRVNGGDFTWEFDNDEADSSSSVDEDLKAALTNYATTLVSIGGILSASEGTVSGGEGDSGEGGESGGEGGSGEGGESGDDETGGTGSISMELDMGGLTVATYSEDFSQNGFTIKATSTNSKTVAVAASEKTVDGVTYTQCLKLGGGGNTSYRSICFTIDAEATMTLVAASSSSGNARTVVITDGTTTYNIENVDAAAKYTQTLGAGTWYVYSASSGLNIYYISVIGEAGGNNGSGDTPAVSGGDAGGGDDKPAVPDVSDGDVSGGDDKPAVPDVSDGDVSGGDDKPVVPDVSDGDVSGGDDKPAVPDVSDGDVSGGDDKPVEPDVSGGDVSGGDDKPVAPDVSGGDDKPIVPDVSDGDDTPDKPEVNEEGLKVVLANPGEEYVYTGSAIKPAIIVTNNGEQLTEGVDYTVKFSNNTNASTWKYNKKTKEDYLAKPAKITVTGKGNLTGSATTTFEIKPLELQAAVDSDALKVGAVVVKNGSKATPVLIFNNKKLTASSFKNTTATTKYYLNEGESTTVVKDGMVLEGKGNFKGTLSVDVTVVAKKQSFAVKVKTTSYTYDGTVKEADILVYDKTDKAQTPLTKGVDYEIVYGSSQINAGTVKFTVVGMGMYSGTVAKTFKIKPIAVTKKTKDLTMTATGVDANGYTYVSSGVKLSDDVKVTYTVSGGDSVVLTEGVDYKLTYSNNKKVTTYKKNGDVKSVAKYTVTFLGNYKGSTKLTGSFIINPAALTDATEGLEVAVADKVFGKNGTYASAPIVTINDVTLKSSNYTVTYYKDAELTDKITGSNKIKAEDFKEGATSVTVYVKIVGKGNYKAATDDQYVTAQYQVCQKSQTVIDISKLKVTVINDETGKKLSKTEYTGNAVTPTIKVEYKPAGSKKYVTVDSSCYEVTYVNNVKKGTATVIVTGNGKTFDDGVTEGGVSFVGSKNAKFKIAAKNLKNLKDLLKDLFS